VRSARVERLRERLDDLGAATFLVAEPVNVRWLIGFESSNAAVLVGRDRLLVATDGRYAEAARALEGIEVVQSERDLAPWLGARLGELAEPPLAFEANRLTYAAYEALAGSGLALRPARAVLEELRSVKDEEELDTVRRAAAVNHAAYERTARAGIVGTSEADLAWAMEVALREAGADALAFPVIVASGPNAALPHHHPGPRTIGAGETVVLDAGARVGGYCSDCTRTFATGALPAELERAYELCREAQVEALAAVRPGVSAREVDALARRRIETGGREVLHGLGHGVGLEVHEPPRLSETSDATLVAGNVVTVEPGVYLPGAGGVRIEDLVVVTDDGPEVLTPFPKELVMLS
jgi:Xaa-Pro aminopeptidase